MVCIELAWPSPSIKDKTPCGVRRSQPSLALVCWSLFHSWGWLGLLHGHVGVDFSCGFFSADFLVRIFGCGFFSRILGCGFFRGFLDGLCGFWGADFFCGFFGLFSRRKRPEKSHQKIPPKNPHQKSSPRNASSQYTTTLILAKHSRSPQSVWVQMHLVENRFFLQMASVGEDERVISTCV